MSEDARETAERRLEQAMNETGARDPREFYRERLRELRERSPSAYEEAVRHYEDVLIPAVASGAEEPLRAWTLYGKVLAGLSAPGRTVAVDPSGRSEPYDDGPVGDRLVLHMPDARSGRALLVGLPAELSGAQRATYDWLVAGRNKLREDAGA